MEQGGRERTSNIGTKDSLSASLPKTFGTPITNKLGDLGLREKSSASLGLRSQTSTASIGESAVKRVRPSSAAASAAAQLGSRGASAEPRKANAKDGRPSSAGPPAPTSSHKPQSASKTAPKSLLAHAGATAARSAKPTSPGKGAPSASAARGAARAGRQATTVAATTSSGKGARSSKAPNTAASSAPRGGRMAPPAASLAASKNGKRAGMKETTDAMDGDTMASEQPLAKEDEVSEHFEDLMAYLMPIADEDSAEGSGDEPEEANEAVPGADGCEDAQEEASAAKASECKQLLGTAPQEAKTDAAAAADAQMGDGVPGPSAGVESDAPPCAGAVTPHVRKVLASSDIFTPESGCESSPGVCRVFACAGRSILLRACSLYLYMHTHIRTHMHRCRVSQNTSHTHTHSPSPHPNRANQTTHSLAAPAAEEAERVMGSTISPCISGLFFKVSFDTTQGLF